jgi:hypothetical protein
MDLLVDVPDLDKAMEVASTDRDPRLDGINYEFYKAFFEWVGSAMADGLIAM